MMALSLLRISGQGRVFIMVILALKLILKNHLPKRTFVILWLTAAVRMLLPFRMPSPVSVWSLFHNVSRPKTYIASTGRAGNIFLTTKQFPPMWFIALWFCASVFLVLYFCLCYLRQIKLFGLCRPVTDTHRLDMVKNCGLRRNILLFESDVITSPVTYGVLKPVIIMPGGFCYEDKPKADMILSHEIAHIKHFDRLTKIIIVLAVCVQPFNPFAWIMLHCAGADMELARDEYVLAHNGISQPAAYANILIEMEEKLSGFAPLHSFLCKNTIEERIKYIMIFKKLSATAIASRILVVSGATRAFAADPVDNTAKEIKNIQADLQNSVEVTVNVDDKEVTKGTVTIDELVDEIGPADMYVMDYEFTDGYIDNEIVLFTIPYDAIKSNN